MILGVVLGASALVNQESAVMALILAVLAIVPWLAGTRARAAAAIRLRAVAAAGLAGVVVASPQLVAMIQQARAGGNATSAASLGYTTWVANLPSLFAPSPRLADDGLIGLGHIYVSQTRFETLNTFGVVLSLLAVLGPARVLAPAQRLAAPAALAGRGRAGPRAGAVRGPPSVRAARPDLGLACGSRR